MICHSLDFWNKNTADSQATMPPAIKHTTAARTVPVSRLNHSVLFGQNLGACVNCERLGREV